MTHQSYPLRVSAGLLELAEIKSRDEHTDRATALRQWLYSGAEVYALELLTRGQLSIARAAELLNLSVADVQLLALERGVEIGATAEQARSALDTADRLGAIRK